MSPRPSGQPPAPEEGICLDTPTSPEDLLARLAGGDRRALALLYDRYAPPVFGLALRRLDSVEEAEEVVQDVFMKVWNGRQVFDARRASFSSWLFILTRNTVYDRLRRRMRAGPEGGPVSLADLERVAETAVHPLEAVLSLEHVRSILERLPREESQIVLMVHVEGWSLKDAARVLGLPVGTVKTRLRRAMRTLKEMALAGEVDL